MNQRNALSLKMWL